MIVVVTIKVLIIHAVYITPKYTRVQFVIASKNRDQIKNNIFIFFMVAKMIWKAMSYII